MPQSGLLQSAMVSLYVLYLTWSAVSNSPQDECKPAGFLPRLAFYLLLVIVCWFNFSFAAQTILWHLVFQPQQLWHLALMPKLTLTSPLNPLSVSSSGSSVFSTLPSPPLDRDFVNVNQRMQRKKVTKREMKYKIEVEAKNNLPYNLFF